MAIPLKAIIARGQGGATPRHDLRHTLAARLAAFLVGGRFTAPIPDPDLAVTALTVVVGDLATAAAVWSARLGGHGEPLDPAQFDEPGLAQQFDLGPCPLILFEPADHTAAGEFLRTHGEGLYTVALRDNEPTPPALAALFARFPVLVPTEGAFAAN
ncbi:MAG TPA: hypothetical protein VIL85_11345 [Thermomicrobiales bacterium]|jgi:hypothetical protein